MCGTYCVSLSLSHEGNGNEDHNIPHCLLLGNRQAIENYTRIAEEEVGARLTEHSHTL